MIAALMLTGVGTAFLRADDFDSDGVKIHYTVSGQGDPVILIHGLYSSAKLNWDLPGTTTELARHHLVITLDNRGHGESGKPLEEGQYGVKMVEDVTRLMDHLKIEKATIVGYSMGGMIALKFVSLHPDRVNSAVLGGMGWLKEGSPLQRFWEEVPARGGGKVPPACLHGFSELALSEKDVKAIHTPVTILVGDRDPCRKMYVEPLAGARPDFLVHEIAGAGHLNCILKPEFKQELEKAVESSGKSQP